MRTPARGPSRRSVRQVSPREGGASLAPPVAGRVAAIDRQAQGAATGAPWAVAGQAPERIDRPGQEEQFSIPTGYGEDRIVLMVKDPWWVFAYWEIQPNTERAARSRLLPEEIAGLQSVLRVYDVTGIPFPSQPAHASFDISLSGLATNWYIHTNAPNHSYIVEIGLLTSRGRFLSLARSNRVTTPRFGPSEVIDESWVTTDEAYWKLFGTSAGVGIGASPLAWSQLLAQQLFSGNWSSPTPVGPSRQSAVRGFWVRVNADLVIHGATEPRAAVSIQGQPVALRQDGTFSLRVAMPEGTQTITIEVTSPDGRTTRTVTPVVTLAWTGSLTPDTTVPRAQLHQPRPGGS